MGNREIESSFEIFKATRKNILRLFDLYSNKELLMIPKGFSNNIIWNMGHILTVQDTLIYQLSGLEGCISDGLKKHFKKGSVPTIEINDQVISQVKKMLMTTSDLVITDYHSGKFLKFNAYMTSYGYEPQSINEAILFNNIHESLHYGYMLAQGKCIKNAN